MQRHTESTYPTTPVPPPEAHTRLRHAKALAALREADRHLASALPRLAALAAEPAAWETHPDADLHDAETGELIRSATRAEVEEAGAEGWWHHEGDSVRSNLELELGRPCYVVLVDAREP